MGTPIDMSPISLWTARKAIFSRPGVRLGYDLQTSCHLGVQEPLFVPFLSGDR